jgi:hypothetical protein
MKGEMTMKSMRLVCALLCCVAFYLVACSSSEDDIAPSSTAAAVEETALSVVSSDQGQATEAISRPAGPYWEVDSLEALDTLLTNADGCSYYYVFDRIPAGLKVVQICMPVDAREFDYTLQRSGGEPVLLYVFTVSDAWGDMPQFEEMVVDGATYYYHQRFDAGGLVVAYFQWIEDGKLFLVHPQEAITPDVIRKYGHVKKVEFNIGKKKVGLGTGMPLIADIDKVKSVIRGNSGIRYHTGNTEPGRNDDLLQP